MGKAFKWKARHTVLAILFVTWVVSFMDRIAMSVAIPYVAVDYNLSPLAMGAVMSAFFASYSISQIPGGLLSDRLGARGVATASMLWWSAFTAITGAVSSLNQMLFVRFLFGLGEGLFPACAFKTIAVWFPQKERATANAIMLASNSFGSALAPLAVVGVMSFFGWRAVFFTLFFPGLLSAVLFWLFVRNKPSESKLVSAEELAEIEGSPAAAKATAESNVSVLASLRHPGAQMCFLILFVFDITLWGFTTWIPSYLVKARGFSLVEMGIAASLPFFAGTVGCILGGWVSDRYFSERRRVPIVASQLLSALLLYLMFTTTSVLLLVIYQTLAGACIKFFTSAFWALPMNTIPKSLMGVASGFINMGGQIAAFISPIVIGYLVGAADGRFDSTFAFLIGTALVSCALVFAVPAKSPGQLEEASNG